ncbi:MAG: BolA/IbaG family iron-sulfur metabolism protein [Candidatus Omnitrophica bacterium]|nr:BolA/IbaG family iron-sulfur metabolism protein [Candidatus Omnitrophota bacterium]
MMRPNEIAGLIRQAVPDAAVEVRDLTGNGDHFYIFVVSSVFKGKMLIEQHRMIQQPLQAALDDGRIHAVQIKTETPEKRAQERSQEDDFHVIQ